MWCVVVGAMTKRISSEVSVIFTFSEGERVA